VDNGEQVSALVQDQWIAATHTADKLNISCGSAYSIQEGLRYHKISAKGSQSSLQMSTNEHAIFAGMS